MITRTPPLKRSKYPEDSSPNSGNRQLIIYEDTPLPASSHHHAQTSDQMLCTYQCRQMVKSEFFDALSSAEKQSRDYQSKFEALNNDYLKADSERKKFREQFLNAEQELAAAKGREEALQDQLLKEVNTSQERLRKQLHMYSELEVKFQHEMSLRKKAEKSAAAAEEKASLLERKLSSVSESIERERSHLQNELEQLKSESKFSVTKIRKTLEKWNSELPVLRKSHFC